MQSVMKMSHPLEGCLLGLPGCLQRNSDGISSLLNVRYDLFRRTYHASTRNGKHREARGQQISSDLSAFAKALHFPLHVILKLERVHTIWTRNQANSFPLLPFGTNLNR
jgi:hypothetical protein